MIIRACNYMEVEEINTIEETEVLDVTVSI
jgi:hypothetical protein